MPTEGQIQTTLSDLFRIANEFLNYATSNAEKFTEGAASHEGEFLGNLQADYRHHRDMVDGVERFRQGLSSQLDLAKEAVVAGLREYAQIVSIPETNPEKILERLNEHMIDNSLWVQQRNITFGTPTADGGNDGDIVCNRLTVDKDGYDLEATTVDAKVVECIADEGSGAAKWEERWELRGADPGRDKLIIPGSGETRVIRGLSARQSSRYLNNPSFDRFTGTITAPTEVSDWTIDSTHLAALEMDSTRTYRDYQGAPDPHYSLKFTATSTVQTIEINQELHERRIAIRPNVPLYVQVAFYKESSGGTGTVNIDLGSTTTVSVNVADLNNDGWTVVRLPTGTSAGGGQDSWYDNQKDNIGLIFDINFSGVDVGRVINIDDVIIAPFEQFDGHWYAFAPGSTVSGSPSKPTRKDKFTFTDALAGSEAIVQYWLWRYFQRQLPPSATPTWSDPT